MSVLDRVKNHISNNRGKYGAATGVGLVYGVSQIDPNNINPMINQAAFNVASRGQNLALDAADKIGYGKEQLQHLGLENKINPNDIQAGNDFYNSEVGKFINPNPLDMVNAAEQSSKVYNKVQEAKAQAQDVVHQAQAQGQHYLDQGVNFVKSLNPFHENTIMYKVYDSILENIGPWDRKKAAEIQHLMNLNDSMSQNYQNNIGQYILNPFVPGPISHLGVKVGNALNGVTYGVLKGKNAPNLAELYNPNVHVDPSKGAWNSAMDANYKSGQQYEQELSKIRDNNPYQYMLNPFVPGPLRLGMINSANDMVGTIRGIASPFSRTGDTLVKR